MTRKYGWPYLYTDQMICTAAMAYAMGLPGSLQGCAAALGVEFQKDMVGSRLMLQMCQPRAVDEHGKIVWWDEPEKLERLLAYCVQDVETERSAAKRMLRLSPKEQEIWILDQKINDRGIAVDLAAAEAAINVVADEKARLDAKMRELTGNQVASCAAVAQIRAWLLERHAIEVPALAKGDVVDLLSSPELPPAARAVLELRQEAGKASTAKLKAMTVGACRDGRIRGTFQYSGANTRRWAGRRIQLQNLPRPKMAPSLTDSILTGLAKGTLNAQTIDDLLGPPMAVISDCIRGCLIAAPGKELVACDFSAIEARVIAWLAGQENALDIFRTHGKIYEFAAAGIYGCKLEDVTSSQRQVGKVAVLALGYQGGVGAFQAMARGYGVTMAPAYPALVAAATPNDVDWAIQRFAQEQKNYPDVAREEFIASDLTKVLWRRANPQIVQFWADLEAAAIMAVKDGPASVGQIKFKKVGSFLWCRLPSGGVICYPEPEVQTIKMPWGDAKEALTYMSEENRKWLRFKTYGGSLAENVTQAVARDLLAESMLRLEASGFEVVAHVHDEAICEVPAGEIVLPQIAKLMEMVPHWAAGLPLKAAGWQGRRYRK